MHLSYLTTKLKYDHHVCKLRSILVFDFKSDLVDEVGGDINNNQ